MMTHSDFHLLLAYIMGLLTVYSFSLIYGLFRLKSRGWKKPKIENNKLTKWNWMVSHPENLKLGKNIDIGAFTYIQAENLIIIEDNVQIGSHCSIYSKNTIDKTGGSIHIEKGARIGAGCVILPKDGLEIKIGKNSKVGAMSLVKDDIPDNSTYAGIPAKPIIKD